MNPYELILSEIRKDPKSYLSSIDLEQFESILRYANKMYNNTDTPIMSDDEYDKFLKIYIDRYVIKYGKEPEFASEVGACPDTSSASVTVTVVESPCYVTGLEKLYPKDFHKFNYTEPFIVTAKLDGASAILKISNNKGKIVKKLYT